MKIEKQTASFLVEEPASRIPLDVIEEILLRLPVSSLLRLRRVCKQWHNLISVPRFIKEHAYRSPKHLLLFFPKQELSGALYPNIVTPCRAMFINEKFSLLTWGASNMDPDDHLFASCNGLLCFYKTNTLKIFNPATGQCLCLHIRKPDRIPLHDFHYQYNFGFHPTTGEYKVVHFLREPKKYHYGDEYHFDTIQVYTLGEDKWRAVRSPCCMVNLGVVNVDRAMYWLTDDEATSCGMAVVSFDLKEETFAPIQLPTLEVKGTSYWSIPKIAYYITEIDEKVCVVTIPYQNYVPNRWSRCIAELAGRMDIWALDSDTEQKWLLKYSIKYSIQSPCLSRCVPQPCFIHREKIIMQGNDGNAWYHDLPGKNMQIAHREEVKLLYLGKYHRSYETQSYFYKETLVPLSVYGGAAIVRAPGQTLGLPVASHFSFYKAPTP